MYEYKQFHVWVMIITFWVLHIFGTSSILSKYDIFYLEKDSLSLNLFSECWIAQDKFEDCVSQEELQPCIDQIYSEEGCGEFYLRRFMKRLKKWKKRFSNEFSVCDNRIDRIDTKITAYLCAKDVDINELSSITVA